MWGAPYVTMRRNLSNGTSSWGVGGSPTNVDISRIGILRKLRLVTDAAATVTLGGGTAAIDKIGPWNQYSQIVVTPNQQAPVHRTSGFGAYLAMMMRSHENKAFSPDTSAVTTTNADSSADFYNAPTSTGDYRNYVDVHMGQLIRSLGTEVGLWPLENPAVQMQLQYTPNSASTASPFNVYSTTANVAPYLVTGAATVTLTTPTIDVRRDLYEVPANPDDNPPYTFVVTTLEETPQTATTTFIEWKATPLSGVLLRLGVHILDSGTNDGVAESSITASNGLTLLFGADTQKFATTGIAQHMDQQSYFGAALPKGFFCWDFLGPDLTLADVVDLYTVPEVRLDVNLAVALGASSKTKIIRETLVPLEIAG